MCCGGDDDGNGDDDDFFTTKHYTDGFGVEKGSERGEKVHSMRFEFALTDPSHKW